MAVYEIRSSKAKYLLCWLPDGYITKAQYLQHIKCSNKYIRDNSLKDFLNNGFIEKTEKTFSLVNKNISRKERYETIKLYVLTPKGLQCIKQKFSEEYPWLKYLTIILDKPIFRNDSKFRLDDMAVNSIGSYLELCGVDQYQWYKYMPLSETIDTKNSFRAMIEKAQRDWVNDVIRGQGIAPDKNYNGNLEQFCQENNMDFEYFDRRLNLKRIRPSMTDIPEDTAGVFVSKKDVKTSLAKDVNKEILSFNLNNTGVLLYHSKPYIFYYCWSRPVFIAKMYLQKLNDFIRESQRMTGAEQSTPRTSLQDSFIAAKNFTVLKFMIEKAYIMYKASQGNKPYYYLVPHLYLTPVSARHLPVMNMILSEPDAIDRLCENIKSEHQYQYIPGACYKRYMFDSQNREYIMMGFDLDGCVIYKLYEELQDYDMYQLHKMAEARKLILPKRQHETDWLINVYGANKANKTTYSKRIYCKPAQFPMNSNRYRIYCFEYQVSFYEYLLKDWIKQGILHIEVVPNIW